MANRTMAERRYPHIKEHIQSKSVLDIGCVEHDPANSSEEYWLHDKIRRDSRLTVGLDIIEAPGLNERGYDIRAADARDFNLDETFDVVVAGELIEHLDNFDGLFSSIKTHLKDDGILILTTPNGMSVLYSLKRYLLGDFVHQEHTCWFDSQTIRQLLFRHGFKATEITFIRHGTPSKSPLKFIQWLAELALPDEIGAQTMVVVAEKRNQH
ncbi:class I SAM-dependent methyltransferase [Natrinema salaciae]|uniref:Methyltransferase domain-containing protein n=1 Tax=Natrinema salaciae TaxID=1186196 RepID=A0A1H9BXK8_9EURY|nr:class I SAM-dependent methyltransferase [Natrinema salaciae]SEP93680.1 Methyltransferase domain-containing protein [Natrinema salaciae]